MEADEDNQVEKIEKKRKKEQDKQEKAEAQPKRRSRRKADPNEKQADAESKEVEADEKAVGAGEKEAEAESHKRRRSKSASTSTETPTSEAKHAKVDAGEKALPKSKAGAKKGKGKHVVEEPAGASAEPAEEPAEKTKTDKEDLKAKRRDKAAQSWGLLKTLKIPDLYMPAECDLGERISYTAVDPNKEGSSIYVVLASNNFLSPRPLRSRCGRQPAIIWRYTMPVWKFTFPNPYIQNIKTGDST